MTIDIHMCIQNNIYSKSKSWLIPLSLATNFIYFGAVLCTLLILSTCGHSPRVWHALWLVQML